MNLQEVRQQILSHELDKLQGIENINKDALISAIVMNDNENLVTKDYLHNELKDFRNEIKDFRDEVKSDVKNLENKIDKKLNSSALFVIIAIIANNLLDKFL